MEVTFKNTGMIDIADINFNGLTVIAGENDTGKSTVGKLMFSIIKTLNPYEKDVRAVKIKQIKSLLEENRTNLSRQTTNPEAVEMINGFFSELEQDISALPASPSGGDKPEERISELTDSFAAGIKRIAGISFAPAGMKKQLITLIEGTPDGRDVYKDLFDKYMASVFNCRGKDFWGNNFSIQGRKNKKELFNIEVSSDGCRMSRGDGFPFMDATLVESPLLLDIAPAIAASKTLVEIEKGSLKQLELLDKTYVPAHVKDFVLKAREQTASNNSNETMEAVKKLIGGDFYYDPREDDFIFRRGNRKFKSLSTAQGIKCMGTVALLEQGGFITPRGLLILDEPESHIHPRWQTAFAQLLVSMVKAGNPVLITSHSPFFIEALKLYSDRDLGKDKGNFYLAEKDQTGETSRIVNVSHDVSPIFELLAETLRELESM